MPAVNPPNFRNPLPPPLPPSAETRRNARIRDLAPPGKRVWGGGGPGSPLRQLLRIFAACLVVLLLLLLAVVGFELAIFQKQGDAPAAVARQFCDSVVHQQYLQASGYLVNADDFVKNSTARDAADGPVRECRVLGRDVWGSFDVDHAAYTVTVVLNDGRHTGTISLFLDQPLSGTSDGARWAVESIDPQLHLDGP